MKDILISIISLLLTVLIIICMVKGLTIGKFTILSIPDIKSKSTNLDYEIEDLNKLKNVTYKSKLSSLESSIKTLTTNKQQYLDLASVSTDSEIQRANMEQTYAMEFLWNKVGKYATQEALTLKWDVVSTGVNNKYTLNFTITGSYIGIINYIYALENDSELAFRIENFKISGTSTQITATFTVSNVGIKQETISTTSNKTNSTSKNEKQEQTKDNTTDQKK